VELFKWIGLALAFVLWSFTVASSWAEDAPDSSQIFVRTIRAQGTGCQPGSVSTAISPDAKIFSLLFDRYEIRAGGSDPKVDKKTCEIDVEFSVPSGWSFTLSSADYRGFADVQAGATAFHEVLYTFDKFQNFAGTGVAPGFSSSSSKEFVPRPPVGRTGSFSFSAREFRGPLSQEYSIHNELPVQKLAWSPCDSSATKTLRISTALLARVLNAKSSARAMLSLDSVDGALNQSFGFQWRRCSVSAPAPGPVPPAAPAQAALVYRFFNGRDNLLTTDQNEGNRLGYRNQGTMFQVFTSAISSNSVPLYRCIDSSVNGRFLSRSADCEGSRFDGVLGYISSAPSSGLVPIARYTNISSRADRLTIPAPVPGDRGRYRYEGVQGYTLPPTAPR